MNVLKIFIVFYIGALFGWILELFYRRFFSQKKWMNPGFLTGPWLPIYGFGLVLLYLIANTNAFNYLNAPSNIVFVKIITIILSMTLIELVGGLIFVKGLKIKLWDYSNCWGNFKGIICPLYSIYWGIIGIIYYFFLNKIILQLTNYVNDISYIEFVLGVLTGIFMIDFGNSLNIANKIRSFAKENKIIVHYELIKSEIRILPYKIRSILSELNFKFSNSSNKTENRYKEYALSGFVFSLFGFNVISLIISLLGLKSQERKKFAIAGVTISLLEITAILLYLILKFKI